MTDNGVADPTAFLTCAELVALVTEYFEDALSVAERARFEEHLSACPSCRTYLAQMRTTVQALGRLDEESVEPQVLDALMGAFRDWKKA
jgi:anti-sigma factor RsiW